MFLSLFWEIENVRLVILSVDQVFKINFSLHSACLLTLFDRLGRLCWCQNYHNTVLNKSVTKNDVHRYRYIIVTSFSYTLTLRVKVRYKHSWFQVDEENAKWSSFGIIKCNLYFSINMLLTRFLVQCTLNKTRVAVIWWHWPSTFLPCLCPFAYQYWTEVIGNLRVFK